MYGLVMVAWTKRQEVLRFSFGVTRMDMIRNQCIRGICLFEGFRDKVREVRLR